MVVTSQAQLACGEPVFSGSLRLQQRRPPQHYLESLKAPRKAFVPISGGGHFAVFMHSDQFLQELVTRVRPLAVGR